MYLTTEQLFLVRSALSDRGALHSLTQTLQRIWLDPAYQKWIQDTRALAPFRTKEKSILNELGLVQEDILQIKINCYQDTLYLTDGLWVPSEFRVFPFSDESEDLMKVLQGASTVPSYDWALDVATGCGHSALQLARRQRTFAYDINPRALIYSQINRTLNAIPGENLQLLLRDLREGIALPLQGHGLILANLPFGPNPVEGVLPLTSGGGADCLAFQKFFFQQLKTWLREEDFSARVLVLGLSFGNPGSQQWQIEKALQDELGVKSSWQILHDVRIPRTNGLREMNNPTDIETALMKFLNCTVYVKEKTPAIEKTYDELIRKQLANGATFMSYGYLDFNVRSQL